MKTGVRHLIVLAFIAFASLFASAASARSWAFNVPVDGNPNFSETFRRNALVDYLGQHNLFGGLANGDTIVVNWTGGTLKYRSNWSVAVYGSSYVFSETRVPVFVNLYYTRADQQRYCSGSYTVTVDGFWQSWEIYINGQLANWGSEFVTTGVHSSVTPLCYHNLSLNN